VERILGTETLFIGAVAAQAGVNIQTIRYYERRRLLRAPKRRASGYRVYSTDAVRRVRFIKGAQELGFSLDEVAELLRLRDDRRSGCASVRTAARTKIGEIEEKVNRLRRMKKALAVLVRSCASDGSTRECPILEALEDSRSSTRRPSPYPARNQRNGGRRS